MNGGIVPTRVAPGDRRGVYCWHGQRRFVAEGWDDVLRGCGLDPATDWTALSPGSRVSDSRVTNCFRIDAGDGESIYYKRYVYTRHKKLRYLARPSKASTEVFGYRQLRRLGIPSLEVIAFDEQRRFGRLVSACIVTRGIPASRDLEQFVEREYKLLENEARRAAYREIRDRLFEQIRRAHRAGFYHQDLHWRNLLVVDRADGGHDVVWIDCPRARYQRYRHHHALLIDLSTLGRVAARHLDLRTRIRALRELLGDVPPYRVSHHWYRRILRHHQGLKNPLE